MTTSEELLKLYGTGLLWHGYLTRGVWHEC